MLLRLLCESTRSKLLPARAALDGRCVPVFPSAGLPCLSPARYSLLSLCGSGLLSWLDAGARPPSPREQRAAWRRPSSPRNCKMLQAVPESRCTRVRGFKLKSCVGASAGCGWGLGAYRFRAAVLVLDALCKYAIQARVYQRGTNAHVRGHRLSAVMGV